MNMKLHAFVNEILDIGKENKVDYDVATNMFLNNIKDVNDPSDQYKYHGADRMNYLSLKPLLEQFEDEKNDFYAAFAKNREKVMEARNNGDYEGAIKAFE
jgi:hypothetical protein